MPKEQPEWKKNVREERQEMSTGNTYKLTEGVNIIRIAPNKKGGDVAPFIKVYQHRGVGPKNRIVRCGKSTKDREGDCYICDELIPELEQTGKRSMKAKAAEMAAAPCYVVQIFVYDDETGKFRGPYVWYMPTGKAKSLAFQILGLLGSNVRSYEDPEKGYNIIIERTGTGLQTTYILRETDPEPTVVPEKLLARTGTFAALVSKYSEEDQRNAYLGRDKKDEKDLPDDDEDKPKKRKPVVEEDDDPPVKKKKVVVEEEDDDDDPPVKKKKKVVEDDEVIEEEPPKKKRKPVVEEEDDDDTPPVKKKKPAAAEDDDDDPPVKKKKVVVEEEDDDDDPPVKKKKVVVEEEDDDDDPPVKKKPRVEEDDDDEPPVKKKKVAVEEDDDDEPPVKKKKVAVEEDDDDEPPVKKKKVAVEEDDDDDDPPPTKKKKKPVDDGDDYDEE